MLTNLIRRVQHFVNVYQGISPSLLATMSLAVNIKGSTHQQLIQNLKKASLISNASTISAFESIDRQLFTKTKIPYDNRPYPISKGQNMTDIFTHAIIMNELDNHWRNHIKILDIGTGHGYLPFLISNLLNGKSYHQHQIVGIDIHDESIQFCNALKSQIQHSSAITFQTSDLKQYLKENKDERFDVIIGGYYFQEDVSDMLAERLSEKGVGIWPTRSEMGQALFAVNNKKSKKYLIETLFSMPVVKSEVSKYFLTDNEQQEYKQENETQSKKVQQQLKVSGVIQRKEMQQRLRDELKQLIEQQKKRSGKVLSLSEMREIPELRAKLDQLQKLRKRKAK